MSEFKLYWFLVAYNSSIGQGDMIINSTTRNINFKNLTDINNSIRKKINVEDASASHISLLGHMTEKEFYSS